MKKILNDTLCINQILDRQNKVNRKIKNKYSINSIDQLQAQLEYSATNSKKYFSSYDHSLDSQL